MSQSTNVSNKQAGMVSIMVTFMLMLVVSLIILGFSQITRHNQREALDRQLSTQAYYAAETAVNDAIGKLQPPASYVPVAADATNCTGANSFMQHAGLNNLLDPSTGTAYTCLLVNPTPGDLKISTLSLGDSKVLAINPSGPGNLVFTWHSSDGSSTNASGCPGITGTFTPAATWTAGCHFGILRLDLAKSSAFNFGAANKAADMASHTASIYFVPSNNSLPPIPPVVNYGQPNIITASCSSGACTARINPGALGNYYGRFSAIYASLGEVKITSPGNTFNNSQVEIDATGKAVDQVRRIVVNVSPSSVGDVPAYALSVGDGICKRYTIQGPGTAADPDWNSVTPPPLCGY